MGHAEDQFLFRTPRIVTGVLGIGNQVHENLNHLVFVNRDGRHFFEFFDDLNTGVRSFL